MSESQNMSSIPEKNGRVISIDVLKGIAIAFTILAHIARINFVVEEKWMMFLVYDFLDIFGPSMFVFLSSVGIAFSIAKKKGHAYEKKTRNSVFQRAGILFLMGCIPNVAFNLRFGILSFWYWWMLQFMAFSQVITYYAFKMPKIVRILLALLILFIINPIIFNTLTAQMGTAGIDFTDLYPEDLGNPYAFVFWLFYWPTHSESLIPWLALPLLGSVVGESLVETMNIGTLEAKRKYLRSLLWQGVILIAISIGFGFKVINFDYGNDIIYWINTNPYFQIPGLPEFLIMRSEMNLLYDLGMDLFIFGIAFYILEIRGVRGKITFLAHFCGRFSLSLFGAHPFLGLWFPEQLPWWGIAIYTISIDFVLYYGLKLLVVRFKGMCTMEWLTAKLSPDKNALNHFYEQDIKPFVEHFRNDAKKVRWSFINPKDGVENPVDKIARDDILEKSSTEISASKSSTEEGKK